VIEAEVKARLARPADVRRQLDELASGTLEVYRDRYFDTPDEALDRTGRELRLRTITSATGTRHVLTFKEPPVHEASRSKPEHETLVSDPGAVATTLGALGYPPLLAFTKECVNYRFEHAGRKFLVR
jgi:adenylate cyclase class 2